jgi:hypothetical protein
LIGEVELGLVQPNIMKTDFDRGSPEWAEVHALMNQSLAPVVRDFQRAGDRSHPSREEKKSLGTVCDELAQAFLKLREDRTWAMSPASEELPERGELAIDPPVLGHGAARDGSGGLGVGMVNRLGLRASETRGRNRPPIMLPRPIRRTPLGG